MTAFATVDGRWQARLDRAAAWQAMYEVERLAESGPCPRCLSEGFTIFHDADECAANWSHA